GDVSQHGSRGSALVGEKGNQTAQQLAIAEVGKRVGGHGASPSAGAGPRCLDSSLIACVLSVLGGPRQARESAHRDLAAVESRECRRRRTLARVTACCARLA